MKVFATIAIAILGLTAQTLAEGTNEAVEPIQKRDIGCAEQGTPSKPAWCYANSCPQGYRSVFWDFGCPSSSWKCCI